MKHVDFSTPDAFTSSYTDVKKACLNWSIFLNVRKDPTLSWVGSKGRADVLLLISIFEEKLSSSPTEHSGGCSIFAEMRGKEGGE